MHNLHKHLESNVVWYKKWHTNKNHHVVHWASFILITVITTFSLLSATNNLVAVETNLLTNPSFEMGSTGWMKATNGGRSIFNGEAHQGVNSLQMLGSNLYEREVYQDVSVTAGKSYDVKAWITTWHLASTAKISVIWLNSTGLSDTLTSSNILRTDILKTASGDMENYVQGSTRYVAPVGAKSARVQIYLPVESDNDGGVWVDDFSFIVVEEVPASTVTQGIVGYWSFNEGTGTSASDGSGNNLTGILTGSPSWVTGKLNNGLQFANSKSVNIPDRAYGASNYTIAAWIKTSGNGWIVGNGEGSDFRVADGKLLVQLYTSTGFNNIYSKTSVNNNQWHHVAMVVSGNFVNLYIDGQLDFSDDFSGTRNIGFSTIGARHDGSSEGFNGILDEVYIFNRALTLSEISTLMNASVTPTPTPTPTPDTTTPTVSITSPTTGAIVSGTATFTATATDNVGVAGVQFKIDNTNNGTEDTTSPYSLSLNTTTLTNGTHTVTAVARDAAGNSNSATSITFTVNNTVASNIVATPTISPNGGTFTSAQSVTLATTTPGATIRYTTSGATPTTGSTRYTGPISISKTATLKAKAFLTGLTSSLVASSLFTITTTTPPPTPAPTISSFTASPSSITAGQSSTLSWTTTGATSVSISGVGTVTGTSTTVAPTVTTTYVLTATNATSSATSSVTVTVSPAVPTLDTTIPTVSITSPTTGAIVSGTATFTATATDNVGVAGVQFKIDNTNNGTEDTTSPYSLSLNTTTLTNGTHTVTAVARDAAGNSTTSTSVSFTVNNAVVTPPPVSSVVCNFYVSPTGTNTGNGSASSPWDIKTALNHPTSVKAGDTICLRGGTYNGRYVSNLAGTTTSPITVTKYPGERVIIDGYKTTVTTAAISSGSAYGNGTITVSDPSIFTPNVGMTARIGGVAGEEVRIDSINGNVINVVRGWNGSCASTCPSYNSGTSIRMWGNVLSVHGSNTIFKGLEITISNQSTRVSTVAGSDPKQGGVELAEGIYDSCNGCRYINNIIHDVANGIGSHAVGKNSIFYGNITYNNGWVDQSGEASGHGMYIQNSSGNPTKFIKHNISFHNSNFGFQSYGDAGGIDNTTYDGNITFDNGRFGTYLSYQMLIGRDPSFVNSVIKNNVQYGTGGAGTLMACYAGGTQSTNGQILNNYIYGSAGQSMLCPGLSSASGNTLIGPGNIGWTQISNNTYQLTAPTTGNKTFVFPNEYEQGRGNIAIFNWGLANTVSVDISSVGLVSGQAYEIKDAQNFYGSPVLTGTYNSSNPIVSISMSGTVTPSVVGTSPYQPNHTSKQFGAFVIVPVTVGNTLPPTPTPVPTITSFNASPSTITAGGSSTLSWSVSGATSLSINQSIGTVTGTSRSVTPTTTTTYTLTATNASGSVSSSVTVTVSAVVPPTPTVDTTKPTVSITTPVPGVTVLGTVQFTATASDNVGVTGVQFKIDGTNNGSEDTTSPYNLLLNTTTLTNGTHTLSATARDAAGNSTTSTSVSFTVNNAVVTPPPTPTPTVSCTGSNCVSVNSSQTFQTIDGWEATAQSGQDVSPAWNNYKNTLLDRAVADGINRLRVEVQSGAENTVDYYQQFMDGQITESQYFATGAYVPVNDNTSSTTMNANGFKWAMLDRQMDEVAMPMRQRLQARGEKLYINVNYVDFTRTQSRSFAHKNNPAEYAEFVLATYQHLQSKYGITPDAWEIILEPDTSTAAWSATQVGNAIKAAGDRLVAAGFSSPKFIAPSTTNGLQILPTSQGGNNWVGQIAAVSGAMQYIDTIAYHRYTSPNQTQTQNIAALGTQYGKKTAMLEKIGADYLTLHMDLKYGNNSAWQQFTLAYPDEGSNDDNTGSKYYNIRDNNISNPTVVTSGYMKFLSQYFKYIRMGAVRLGATNAGNPFIDPIAFRNTNGKYVVVSTVSGAPSTLTFGINSLPAGTYGISYTTGSTTTATTVQLADQTISSGQAVNVSLPAGTVGVVTVYGK